MAGSGVEGAGTRKGPASIMLDGRRITLPDVAKAQDNKVQSEPQAGGQEGARTAGQESP